MNQGEREALKNQLKDIFRVRLREDIEEIEKELQRQGKPIARLEIIRNLRNNMMRETARLKAHTRPAAQESIDLKLEAYLELTDEFLQEAMKGDA